jgi:renalase
MISSGNTQLFDVAIIGAGISGLAARFKLASLNKTVITLEKSRGLGGRIATRRGEDWIADLGAQYTSARGLEWLSFLGNHRSDIREVRVSEDVNYPRYIHQRGMSALARGLSEVVPHGGQIVVTGARVTAVRPFDGCWEVRTESGAHFFSRSVLSTLPVPQVLDLLKQSDLPFGAELEELFSQVTYGRSLALGVLLKETLPLSISPIFRPLSDRIAGVYDQKRKGLVTKRPIVVIHTTDEFSSALWESDDSQIATAVMDEVANIFAQRSVQMDLDEVAFLHRWRVSEVRRRRPKQSPEGVLFLRGDKSLPPFALSGDGLDHSSVEAAFQSGLYAGLSLADYLKGSHA